MSGVVLRFGALLCVAFGLACAGRAVALLIPPTAAGPLELRVVYPRPLRGSARAGDSVLMLADSAYRLPRRDSTFLFGSVGRADATLRVNGEPVPIYPTGGWIAWLPLRVEARDTAAVFDLVASAGGDTAQVRLVVALERAFAPPDAPVWIDSTSVTPTGDGWVRSDEGFHLSVRAAPGALVRARLTDGRVLEFLPDSSPEPRSWGERAFETRVPAPPRPRSNRYVAWWVGSVGPPPGPVLSPLPVPEPGDSSWMWVEAISGSDTARARWPLRVGTVDPRSPPVVVVDDDPAATGTTDSVLAGRPNPHGTYLWFFPNGTRAVVSGRWNDQVRLQLSRTSVAWVDARDVHPLPAGTPPPDGTAGPTRLVPEGGSVTLRIPLASRVPFRVEENETGLRLILYRVAFDADFVQYGATDSWVRLITFAQESEDQSEVKVTLASPAWGYRLRWEGTDLALEIRRPPVIQARRPLAGRLIALDPGHPPLGATGPTGISESEVTLAVALKAKALLEARGANVYLTRTSDSSVSLVERVRGAEQANADLLISIHANALPEGVNPFVNSGTSVYYYHPRSAALARGIDRALVAQFGQRDLGIGRGDLALARTSWMPAVLVEGLFLMLPDQESVLRSEQGQWRYARGLVEGIEAFLGQPASSR